VLILDLSARLKRLLKKSGMAECRRLKPALEIALGRGPEDPLYPIRAKFGVFQRLVKPCPGKSVAANCELT
jgi:hypothetical protein